MNIMKRNDSCLLLLIILILIPSIAFSDLFPIPPIDENVAFIYSLTPVKKDEFINKKWGISVMNAYIMEQHKWMDGKKHVLMTREFTDKKFGTTILTLEFKVQNNSLKQTQISREIIKFSGESVLSYSMNFENIVQIYPEDCYASEIMTFLFRGIGMVPKSKFEYHWWVSEKAAVPLYGKIKKPKKITTSKGKYTCYPIELYVDVANFVKRGGYFNKLINPFMPDYVAYIDVNPPHYFVHYEGPLGFPGSPSISLNLVKIVKGPKAIENVRQKLRSPKTYATEEELFGSRELAGQVGTKD